MANYTPAQWFSLREDAQPQVLLQSGACTASGKLDLEFLLIVLAAKQKNRPKKLNTVLDECYELKARGMQAWRTFC